MTSDGPSAERERVSGAVVPVARAVARRPWLWPVALEEAWRLARPGWWHRWPPLPVPDSALWRFRMETAYGGRGDQTPRENDIVSFLSWARAMRGWRRR